MTRGKTPIIIDNTNILAWHMKPYAVMVPEDCGTIHKVRSSSCMFPIVKLVVPGLAQVRTVLDPSTGI
ncbi:hypothetical protein AB205_0187860, partial [Aquarana catesbeiana]